MILARSAQEVRRLGGAISRDRGFPETKSSPRRIGLPLPDMTVMRLGLIQLSQAEQCVRQPEAGRQFGFGKEADRAVEVRRGAHRIISELREPKQVRPASVAWRKGCRLRKAFASGPADFVGQ